MEQQARFTATIHLKEELDRNERSAAWLARKIKVSQQFMSFVLRNERTIKWEKAVLAAAALGKDIDFLFAPVSTDRNILSLSEDATALERKAA